MGINYNSMTAAQRARARRYTIDETGKANFTLPNAKLPEIATPAGPTHIHIHVDDDDPVLQVDPSRRPAQREPALQSQGDDLLDRVLSLEQALAAIIQGNAGLSDDFGGGGGVPGQGNGNKAFATGSEPEGLDQQMASRMVAEETKARAHDALPEISELNQKNRAFWGSQTGTSAGGSPSTTPAPGGGRESESARFQPNQAGGINGTRRMSTTGQRLDPGKTSGWGTADMAMQDRAMFWKMQRLDTNAVIARINRKHAVARSRDNWGM